MGAVCWEPHGRSPTTYAGTARERHRSYPDLCVSKFNKTKFNLKQGAPILSPFTNHMNCNLPTVHIDMNLPPYFRLIQCKFQQVCIVFFFSSHFDFAAPCPDPGVPYQGYTIDQDFRHDRTVRFTCPINYVMEGVAAIKCTNGRWSNNKPNCKGNLTLENRNNVTLKSVFSFFVYKSLPIPWKTVLCGKTGVTLAVVVSGKHITSLSLALRLSNKLTGIFVGLGSHGK